MISPSGNHWAARRINSRANSSRVRGEDGGDELGEGHGEGIEVPGGVAEEAMEAGPVPDADLAAGEDDLGDIAVAMREDPPGDDHREGLVGGCSEDRGEDL